MDQTYTWEYTTFRDEFKAYKISTNMDVATTSDLLLHPTCLEAETTRVEGASIVSNSALSSSQPRKSSTVLFFDTDPLIPEAKPRPSRDVCNGHEMLGSKKREDQVISAVDVGNCLTTEKNGQRGARKGHKKSRQGCYGCKRRKIKCQETQPECENCTRKKIKCKYPAPKTLAELQMSVVYAASPVASISLQPTPTVFTLTDMRLFHHFLMSAYPHLPVGSDSVWLNQVPLIAHHNAYLMHAILGLAASHLQITAGIDLSSIALHHRVLAIKGSNAAISKPHRSGSDADAILGACYALVFQSAYMRDGLLEFFQTIRGCDLLSEHLKMDGVPMAFFLIEKDHFHYMEDKLLDLPVIDRGFVDGAEISLDALPPLFTQPSHPHFHQLLSAVVEALKLGSLGTYFKFLMVYQGVLKMNNQMFQEFIDPRNDVARILIAHFLAIQMIVAPIIDREYNGRKRTMPARGHMDWIDVIYVNCPACLKRFIEWPFAVRESMRTELGG